MVAPVFRGSGVFAMVDCLWCSRFVFCSQRGIHVTAYSPLGSTGSPLFKDESVLRVAERRGVSVGCVLLSYHGMSPVVFTGGSVEMLTETVNRKSSVLAKSVTPSRIEENMKIIDLSEQDMKELNQVHQRELKRFVFPPFGPTFGFPDKEPATATAGA